MTDLRSILKSHEEAMAQRNTVEFDATSIAQTARRRRAMSSFRTGAMAAAVAGVIGVGAWWGLTSFTSDSVPPALSPSPIVSPTPSPTATPVIVTLEGAPTAGPWAQYFVDAEYTDLEPASGERWLTEPVLVDVPDWVDPGFSDSWYVLGARDGNAILGNDLIWTVLFYEVNEADEPTYLEAAVPDWRNDESHYIPRAASVNSTVTYESLERASAIETPAGRATQGDEGVAWELPPGAQLTLVRSETGGDLYEVRRSMPEHNWTWDHFGMAPNPPFGAWDVDYAVQRPYGAWLVYWAERPSDVVVTTNGFDTGCFGDTWGFSATLATGVDGGLWNAGSGTNLLPTANNPVLQWWHDMHVARYESGENWGRASELGLLTADEYRNLPGMVATAGPEQDSWFIWLNQDVSQRDFC